MIPAIRDGSPRATLLVAMVEPVPAFLHVGLAGLPGIGDEACSGLGCDVHTRAGGEIVGRLGASVQHDDQGNRLPAIAGWYIQFVWPRTFPAAEVFCRKQPPVSGRTFAAGGRAKFVVL